MEALKFGNGVWATKTGSSMAYNDHSGNYKPLPFNVVRNSIATRVNKEGLIEVVGHDKLRIDYTDTDKGVALLENTSTNLVTYSEDFSQSAWQKLGLGTGSAAIVTSDYDISPDGTQNASRLQCDLNNGGSSSSNQSLIAFIYSNSGNQTISIYLKSNNGQNQTIYFANTQTSGDTITVTTQWQRFEFNHSTATYVLAIGLRGRSSGAINDTADILIWAAQAEANSFPTSYIPTSGSAVTRAADVANNAGNSEVFNDSEGVLFADVDFLTFTGNDYFGLNDGTNNQRILIERSTTNIKAYVNAVSLIAPISSLINKTAVSYKANDYKLYLNGFKVVTDTSSSVTPSGLNAFEFELGGGFNLFAYLKAKQIGYYDAILTDAELEKLTSYNSLSELVTELNLNTL